MNWTLINQKIILIKVVSNFISVYNKKILLQEIIKFHIIILFMIKKFRTKYYLFNLITLLYFFQIPVENWNPLLFFINWKYEGGRQFFACLIINIGQVRLVIIWPWRPSAGVWHSKAKILPPTYLFLFCFLKWSFFMIRVGLSICPSVHNGYLFY